MRKEIVDLIIEHKGRIFPNKKIEDVELVFSQEYKLSWIYKLRLNKEEAIVAKAYKKPRISGDEIKDAAKREYQTLKSLEERFSGQEEFRIARPLGYLAQENIILLEEIYGRRASDFIKQSLAWLPSEKEIKEGEEIFFRIGGWLRFFQEKTAQPEKVEFNLNEFKGRINKKYQECQKLGLNLSARRWIEKALNRILNNWEAEALEIVGRHGDFTPWNAYIDEQRVYVIDFSEFEYGFPYDDLTLFLITLEGYKNYFRISKKNITRLKQSFWEGYGQGFKNIGYYHLFMLFNILEILSWAKEMVIRHAYHKFKKRWYIKFYERFLKEYCLSIVENED